MREWCAVPRCSSAVEKSSGRAGHVHVKKEGPANGRSGQVDPQMLPKNNGKWRLNFYWPNHTYQWLRSRASQTRCYVHVIACMTLWNSPIHHSTNFRVGPAIPYVRSRCPKIALATVNSGKLGPGSCSCAIKIGGMVGGWCQDILSELITSILDHDLHQ
jgi:hypothetical protein